MLLAFADNIQCEVQFCAGGLFVCHSDTSIVGVLAEGAAMIVEIVGVTAVGTLDLGEGWLCDCRFRGEEFQFSTVGTAVDRHGQRPGDEVGEIPQKPAGAAKLDIVG